MKDKLLIIGASGHGKVVADIALQMKRWHMIAFLDDDENTKTCLGREVIGKSSDAPRYIDTYDILVGIGNNATREMIQEKLQREGASFPVLIHPSAQIGSHVDLGSGTVVMASSVINCSTKIGKGSIINTGATVDHDNWIEDYVHISPGVTTGGNVKVGKGTWIGIGSIVSNNINITSGCTVGAGAVVIKDIADSGTYIGLPARKMKE